MLMIVDQPPKLDSEESNILLGSLGISSENQSNKVIYKMVSTYILRCWDESKTQLHPITIALNILEHIPPQFCSIILK